MSRDIDAQAEELRRSFESLDSPKLAADLRAAAEAFDCEEHPGRPDRPEGPPPTITREDVEQAIGKPFQTKDWWLDQADKMYIDITPLVRAAFARPLTPADQALETLAMIAEHRLVLEPADGNTWRANSMRREFGRGFTIGDAVRDCVQRLKEKA